MPNAVVSMTHMSMGPLMYRRGGPPPRPSGAAPPFGDSYAHWSLRVPTGCLVLDVYDDEAAWAPDYASLSSLFRDPLHNFSCRVYHFVDDEAEQAAMEPLRRAKSTGTPSFDPTLAGDLKNRLCSFNHVPRLPDGIRDDVHKVLHDHEFASVVHFALAAPEGELLLDVYLDEPPLLDDFLAVHDVLAGVGYPVENETFSFIDRAHERLFDRVAANLGFISEPVD